MQWRHIIIHVLSWGTHSSILGLPCGSAGKQSTCNVGDLGSIPGLGRFPGEGNGYPLHYYSLENSMDCIVHGVAKSWTWLGNFHFHMIAVFELTHTLFPLLLWDCESYEGGTNWNRTKVLTLQKNSPAPHHIALTCEFPLTCQRFCRNSGVILMILLWMSRRRKMCVWWCIIPVVPSCKCPTHNPILIVKVSF